MESVWSGLETISILVKISIAKSHSELTYNTMCQTDENVHTDVLTF